MKTVKKIVSAASAGGQLNDEQLDRGLLELRNTPRADGRSPAQVLFGHTLRSGSVPMHHRAYAAEWQRAADQCDGRAAEIAEDVHQRHDSRSRSLRVLPLGGHADIQNTETRRWDRSGVVVGIGRRKSYLIKLPSGRIWWRNRRFLRPRRPLLTNPAPQNMPSRSAAEVPLTAPAAATRPPAALPATDVLLPPRPAQPAAARRPLGPPAPAAEPLLRRSDWERRPPPRLVVSWDGQRY